ncbi:unnamed protein product, partial [Meganyctiphanes norvegica]
DSSSALVWQITTGLLLAILLIIVIDLKRRRMKKVKIKEFGMEEGEPLLLVQDQGCIKELIRSTHTDPHRETNQQMASHQKEVFKMKLKIHKENFSKKMLGKLDKTKPTKAILVVGQTGSGKSSFINAMANYIYGVTFDDSYRFKLIDDMNKSNDSGSNNTDAITAYCIPFMYGIKHECNYIFMDTPGFGDSRGIDEDKKWNYKFHEFLNKNPDISEVDGICFVIKITDTRLTVTQRYIIDSLFSMFGKDIKNNIYAVVSHSDGSKTHAPNLLQESGMDYNMAINFNSHGLYNDADVEFDLYSPEYINKRFVKSWDLTMKDMNYFFKHLMKTTAVSLSLTNIVLEENKDINTLKDELLELMAMETDATDQERQDIQSKIEQNQELLMMKIVEAQKLSGRLKNIPAKENPLVLNEYIDNLIQDEKDSNKISELEKIKKRNTSFQELLNQNKSNKNNLLKYILGEKTEKTE